MAVNERKTYSHLAGQKRIPSEYEIATTGLLYYPGRGFEIDAPLRDWYERYQVKSGLIARDWEAFRDPRETTYARYTALQSEREQLAQGFLTRLGEPGYDERLSAECRAISARVVSPFRFVGHAMQMLAAYVGHMAPSGRITVTAAFQSADEMRRVQRIAQRLAILRRREPTLGDDGKAIWTGEPAWQPMRGLIERLLVTYDWGEAFVALSLCTKPAIDRFVMLDVGAIARDRGDYLMAELLGSLYEDCVWHGAWSAALLEVASATPESRYAIAQYRARWMPEVEHAIRSLEGYVRSEAT